MSDQATGAGRTQSDETMSASRRIEVRAEAIFDALADPTNHAAIDGTGWVCEPVDAARLQAAGQIFRMRMFHPEHPDGGYEMANRVEVHERPHAIAWKPGYRTDDGSLAFGGWVWRYDLEPVGPGITDVTLSYDWSAITDEARAVQSFPPFPLDHLRESLAHLDVLTVEGTLGG